MPTYTNPIIPGFNPDPSVCLVDSTYYLVTSSFLAFPAIPLYASHDLVNWTQICNVVSRNSQLDMSKYHVNIRGESGGVWAPTIRYHDGLFYVNVTCVVMTDDMDWMDTSRFHSFIWTSPDPFTTPFSDPVSFDFPGFDTSLFWDQDGKAYVQGSQAYKSFSARQISQYEIDLRTGKSLSGEPKFLWDGTGGIFTEAPHIFFKDGYYYLLIAEGGTYMEHSAVVARSKDLWGPYETQPTGPALKPPAENEYVQTIGHADFLKDHNGNWWAVALGTRISPDKSSPMGRETYLIEGSWPEGGWPTFTQPVKIASESANLPEATTELNRKSEFTHSYSQDFFCSPSLFPEEIQKAVFSAAKVNPTTIEEAPPRSPTAPKPFALHWVHVRNPVEQCYNLTSPLTLSLTASQATLSEKVESPSFVARRQTTEQFVASVILTPAQMNAHKIEAGFTVFLDAIRHAEIYLTDATIAFRSTTMGALGVTSNVAPLSRPEPLVSEGSRSVRYTPNTRVKFIIRTEKSKDASTGGEVNEYAFSFDGGHGETELGRVKAIELSVGFTGTLVGMYATGQEAEAVLFSDFKYAEGA